MKERIKTVILVLLVSTSLYLSYTLWTSFPQKSFFMTKSTPSSVDIFNLVRPSSISINSNGTFENITSADDITSIWTSTVKLLKEGLNSGSILSQEDKNSLKLKNNLIDIEMGNITKDVFANALHLENLPQFKNLDSDAHIKEIIITTGEKPQLILTDFNTYYAINLKNSNYFDDLINEKFQSSVAYKKTTADDVYNKDAFEVKKLVLGKYINKGFVNDNIYKSITRKVFVNISVVREIKENNGVYVYTDGVRGLRLYRNGLIEYFDTTATSSKSGMDRIESLNKALEFIKDVGINLDDVYLTGIKDSDSGYNFSFNYIYDYPVYLIENGEKIDPINVSVSNGIIKAASVNFMDIYYAGSYKRNHYDIQKAIEDNKIKDVKSLKLVYIFDNAELLPAWEVICNDKDYFLNALNGKIIQ